MYKKGYKKIRTYKPTSADIDRLKPKPDMLKVSGDGVFATLQGEGLTTGKPAIFLRLHYCNLECGQSGGWKCDTGYTWDRRRPEYWQEPEDWTYLDTANRIKTSWKQKFVKRIPDTEKRLVITGGEPLLQQKKIAKLLQFLPNWIIEIETNGTISPDEALYSCQFNCSPKLKNSGNSLQRRYKPEVLRTINCLAKTQFKFVVIKPSDLEEIDGIVEDCKLDSEKILIMPEGQTAEEVSLHADRVREPVKARGWKITMRNQLVWYGPKRRT